MLQFTIQINSDIPASQQLFDQIQFAIASRQFPPGHRLPSLRQLEMITGLHRNTINKVYQQLEKTGLVESIAGSGIYVKTTVSEEIEAHSGRSPLLMQYPQASETIRQSLDQLLAQGCTLSQARELFLAEVDWRLRCGAQVFVTVPGNDLGAGELMVQELEQALAVPVQLIPLEELDAVLEETQTGTIITSRYFLQAAEAIAQPHKIRVIPIDIYNYAEELQLICSLPKESRLGVVSLSPGILRIAEILIFSLRGNDIFVSTAQAGDRTKLKSLIRNSQTIVCDPASYPLVEQAIQSLRDDLIRKPKVMPSKNYINEQSLELLTRELGLS